MIQRSDGGAVKESGGGAVEGSDGDPGEEGESGEFVNRGSRESIGTTALPTSNAIRRKCLQRTSLGVQYSENPDVPTVTYQ